MTISPRPWPAALLLGPEDSTERETNGIGYPLLSDVHREVITAYGVTFENFAIDGYTVAQRSVFVVEEDGTIGYAWYAENPGIEPDYDALFAHIGA